MATQTQTNRELSRLENFLILTVGATAGGVIAFLLLGLGLNSLEMRHGLSPIWHWVPPAARQAIVTETALMWPAAAKTSAYWYMSRGAGLVSYVLLWATTAYGPFLKGVFVTTSSFSKDAAQYAAQVSGGLVLVDGAKLVELMIEHGVGVSYTPVRIARVDSDYFEEA